MYYIALPVALDYRMACFHSYFFVEAYMLTCLYIANDYMSQDSVAENKHLTDLFYFYFYFFFALSQTGRVRYNAVNSAPWNVLH